MNFVFSWLSNFKEEFEHTHAHTYIKELLAFNNVHVPVFLHTRTQQLRVAPDKKKYSGCMCTFANQIKTIKLFKYEKCK